MSNLSLICKKSKEGYSLEKVSKYLGISTDEVKEILVELTHLTPDELEVIFRMKQRGLPLEEISQDFLVDIEVLSQFLSDDNTKVKEDHPDFICGLFGTHLSFVEVASGMREQQQPLHKFNYKSNSRATAMPGGCLFVTGGVKNDDTASKTVVKIDLSTFEASDHRPMRTARHSHSAVYHDHYLYTLGGENEGQTLDKCERYATAANRWEAIPPLPKAASSANAIGLEDSLYVLGGEYSRGTGWGGREGGVLSTIQKLNLASLTWELLELRLPMKCINIPCFVYDAQVHFINGDMFGRITPHGIREVNHLPAIRAKSLTFDSRPPLPHIEAVGPCYYIRSTLHYADCSKGELKSLSIELFS
jgi:hypothetical protein